MIDTLEVRYHLPDVTDEAAVRALSGLCPKGLNEYVRVDPEGNRLVGGWRGEVPKIGNVGLSVDGWVSCGGSLSLRYQELVDGVAPKESNNGRVLTASEADTGWQAWDEAICSALPVVPETLDLRRVDVVYDRRVPSTGAVLEHLAGAVRPTRKGCSWFDNGHAHATGLRFEGGQVVHRVYDKGYQAGIAAWRGILRSEEQLRSRAKAVVGLVDVANRHFDREAAIEILNARYLDVAYKGKVDVLGVIEDRKWAVVCALLAPEKLDEARDAGVISDSTYYRIKAQAREVRAEAVPPVLRVPSDAYLEQ